MLTLQRSCLLRSQPGVSTLSLYNVNTYCISLIGMPLDIRRTLGHQVQAKPLMSCRRSYWALGVLGFVNCLCCLELCRI